MRGKRGGKKEGAKEKEKEKEEKRGWKVWGTNLGSLQEDESSKK